MGFVPALDDELTNVEKSGYDGGCDFSCAVLFGDIIKGRPGACVDPFVTWDAS